MNKTKTIRKVIFSDMDKSVIRTQLNLPGGILCPPLLLQFREKLYRNTGAGLDCVFYNQVTDFMVAEEV